MMQFNTSLLWGTRAGVALRAAITIISGTIILRQFTAFAPNSQANLSHPLIWSVDWSLVSAGRYAVVDPMDPTHLVYLKEGEYHKLSNVIATNEDRLIVIAHPLDPKPKAKDILAPKPEISPPPSPQGSSYFYRGLRSRLGRSYRAFLAKGKTMLSPDKLTERLLIGFLIRLVAITAHFVGIKELQTVNGQVSQRFASHIASFYRNKGVRGVVLLLKTSMLMIQQYLGNTPKKSWDYDFPVRCVHGLPQWLPVPARHAIRMRCPRVIRFWLSLLYVYKILAIPYDIGKALASIQTPPLELGEKQTELLKEFRDFLRKVWVPSLGGVRPLPKDNSYKMFIPVSAGPNGPPAINHVGTDAAAWMQGLSRYGDEWPLFKALVELSHLFKVKKFIRKETMEVLSKYAQKLELRGFEVRAGKVEREPILSRVHLLAEPAGKVRAVGIIDIFTQRILRPLHDDLFKVLKKLPWDGTMNQNNLMCKLKKQFTHLQGKGFWSSIDISSATDSIPVILYEILLDELYGKKGRIAKLGSLVLTLMTDREFAVSADSNLLSKKQRPIELPGSIKYTRGQPMGCLGSFALLGLWNNAWIAFSAYKQTGQLPVCYGVTGDDVVICDMLDSKPIAASYLEGCSLLGIPISIPKSFASSSIFNFLSRTVIPEGEISPISWKEELTIVSAADRVERAFKLRDRDYWSSDGNGWLSKAIKYFLTPAEYLLHVKDVQRGVLSGYGLRAVLAYLVPSSRNISTLGLQGVSIFSILSACAGIVTILSHGQTVREDSLSTQYTDECRDTILDSLISLLTSEIIDSYSKNDALRSLYKKWFAKQHPCLRKSHFSELFLPSPDIFNMGDASVMSSSTVHVELEDENLDRRVIATLPEGLDDYTSPFRPNSDLQLPGNEESLRKATLNFMIRWLEEIPVLPNFHDIKLFDNAVEQMRRGKVDFTADLSVRTHRIFGAVWQAVLLSGGKIDIDFAPGLVDAIEKRSLRELGLL